jgi:8-amino-7-oxononanoate synthase
VNPGVALLDALEQELAGLDGREARRRRSPVEPLDGARVRAGGRELVAFCSNDYLGLAGHPALVDAACEGARQYGVGAGAAHLVSGHGPAHERLEVALAAFAGTGAALLLSTGYMANAAVVTALAGRGDALFADRLNHASLNDAALLSRAAFRRYPHGDLDALARLLRDTPARRRIVLVDGVFSMDGDIAPLPALHALCERHDALLVVDDAHGFGVLGRGGRGVLSHFGIASPRVVYMGTLGKAAGVFGAFVAADPRVIETLVNRARTYIFTTALPPLLAVALSTSLELIAAGDALRERLRAHVDRLRAGLAGTCWRLLPSETAIQPVVIGDNAGALRAAARLRDRGFLVPAIRPPTVPPGTARLRIALSAAHSAADVDGLVAALRAIGTAA